METNIINNVNQDTFKYNTITEYLIKKCAEDDKFKEQLKEMIDIAEKKYHELEQFLAENKKVISEGKIKIGYELLQKNQTLVQNLSSIIDPDELNILEQFNRYKNKIDPVCKKIRELKKNKEGELIDELNDVKKNISEVKEKIEITKILLKKIKDKNKDTKKENNLSKDNKCNKNISKKDFDENKIDENIINLDESNDIIKESNKFKTDVDNKEVQFLHNEIKYLNEQHLSLLDDKMTIHKKLMKLHSEIITLQKENPLNKLDKYDKLVVMYLNKINILNEFLIKVSTKIFSIKSKLPKFK